MTLNYPHPYQVVIDYTTVPSGFQPMTHKLSFNLKELDGAIQVGDAFDNIAFLNRLGTGVYLDVLVDAVIAGLQPFYPASTDFIQATLYKYEMGSQEGLWQSVYAIAENGTSANPSIAGHQVTWTLRTSEGGISRFQLMEEDSSSKTKQAFPTGSARVEAIRDLLIDPAQPFVGQDGGWLVAGNFYSQTFNEKLEKKRYRT